MSGTEGAEPGKHRDEDISVGVLNYTVCHETRVEMLAVEAYRSLPKAVKALADEGTEVPDYVIDCIFDPDYKHDIKAGAGNHDWAKGDWHIPLLCGEKRPTCREWLEEIYSHPELSARHIRKRKGLEDALHITGRAIRFIRGHHLRHDGNNLFYDGQSMWYKGKKIRICMEWEDGVFFSSGSQIRWHKNMIMKDGELTRHMGYGPRDCYLLAGKDLELGAEIIKAADAFDSMTSGRKHRPDRTYDDGLLEMEDKAGSEFNPIVVRAFKMIPRNVVLEIMSHQQ